MHVYNAYKHTVQTLVLAIQGHYSCMYIMHISKECKHITRSSLSSQVIGNNRQACGTCQKHKRLLSKQSGTWHVQHIMCFMPMATFWKFLPSPDPLTHTHNARVFPYDVNSGQGHGSGGYVEHAHQFEDALAAYLNRKCL